jgi:methylglutaconyl-CoA hydratase
MVTDANGEPVLGVRHDGDVCVITLNRPARRNALSRELIAALHESIGSVAEGDGTRVVVLAGNGPVFCAGGDIAEYAEAAGTPRASANAEALARLLAAIADCPVPVVARVHGDAYGGGVGLLCAADIVVATPGGRFSLSEARLGLVPAAIARYMLLAMGERQALAQMLLAAPFGAMEARDWGVVHRVVPDGELDAAIEAVIGQLRLGAPSALATVKRLPRLLAGRDRDQQHAAVVDLHADTLASDEGREGLAAFLDKRRPAWAPPDRDRRTP